VSALHRRSSDPRWPESCVDVRKDAGEALTGVRAGWAIEPRNHQSGVPTLSKRAEGNIAGGAIRESPADPARSKNLCMYGISTREALPAFAWVAPGN